MATNECRLLSRIIQTGAMQEVIDYGITEEDFNTSQTKAIWGHLYGYFKSMSTKGSVPPPDLFQQMYSHFEFVDAPTMTTDSLCFEVRKTRLTLTLKAAAEEAALSADEDPITAATAIRQTADSILAYGNNKSGDIFMTNQFSQLIKNYEMQESGQIQPVMHWPWQPLDEEVGGVSEEDYILFWGRPKSKKTFCLTYVMADAVMNQRLRVLCYTKEMTPNNMLLRTAAFMGQLPYRETRLAKLSPYDKATLCRLNENLIEAARASNGRNELIILSGKDGEGRDGAIWLASKIKEYKPDVCFVDGLYLLNDDRGSKRTADWQRVMHISRDIRQMILETHVPVVATMQASRGAAKNQDAELDEIAYSDAVGQDITQGFRVVNEKHSPTIALIAGGSREYQLHGIRIGGVPCQDFSFKEIMTEREIARTKESDEKDTEAEDPKAHAKPRTKPRVKQLPGDITTQLNQLNGH